AAPQHGAVPLRSPFARIQRVAHQRMNAVGADQHVAMRGRSLRAVTIEEIRGHAAFVLAKGAEPMPGMDTRLAEPGAHRLPDHCLQPAAVDGELRDVVTRIGAAQLAPDLLAET